jgi:twitching motility protein PilT
MVANPGIRNLIRENKVHQIPSAIQTGAREGMQSLDQALKALVKTQKISNDEAVRRAVEKQAFAQDGVAARNDFAALRTQR